MDEEENKRASPSSGSHHLSLTENILSSLWGRQAIRKGTHTTAPQPHSMSSRSFLSSSFLRIICPNHLMLGTKVWVFFFVFCFVFFFVTSLPARLLEGFSDSLSQLLPGAALQLLWLWGRPDCCAGDPVGGGYSLRTFCTSDGTLERKSSSSLLSMA